jgi:hypothetical protein
MIQADQVKDGSSNSSSLRMEFSTQSLLQKFLYSWQEDKNSNCMTASIL